MKREFNENTYIINEDSVPYISFKSLQNIPWLKCGFSTRLGGVSKGCYSSMNMSFARGDDEADVMQNIRLFSGSAGFCPEDIVMPHQCHSVNVQIVGKNERGRGIHFENSFKPVPEEEIDGQITDEKHVVLYCLGADCVPVFLADTEKKVIAAVHAGWRGTINDITSVTLEKMKITFGCSAKDIKAVIGPSICQDCYEVSEDVAEKFIGRYKNEPMIIRPASGDYVDNPTGKYYLNLWQANRVNLMNAGVSPENIEISGCCTKCNPDMFFSHRVHGNNRGVNIGFIYII